MVVEVKMVSGLAILNAVSYTSCLLGERCSLKMGRETAAERTLYQLLTRGEK